MINKFNPENRWATTSHLWIKSFRLLISFQNSLDSTRISNKQDTLKIRTNLKHIKTHFLRSCILLRAYSTLLSARACFSSANSCPNCSTCKIIYKKMLNLVSKRADKEFTGEELMVLGDSSSSDVEEMMTSILLSWMVKWSYTFISIST